MPDVANLYSPQGVPRVRVDGGMAATTWVVTAPGGSANIVIAAPLQGKINITSVYASTAGTIDFRWQSPSGTDLSGSIHLLPGGSISVGAANGSPVLIGAAAAPIVANIAAATQFSGWATGFVEGA